MKKESFKVIISFVVTAAALVLVFFAAVNTGGLHTGAEQLFRGLFIEYDDTVAVILQIRFPRIFVAMLGGAVMSVSGVLMQAAVRNPLADPGIIGVSSGAAFAAVVVSCFFPSLAFLIPVFSFAGGMAAFVIVYLLSMGSEMSPVRLILTGIAADAFFGGMCQTVNSFSGNTYSGVAGIINANISLKTWDDVYTLLIYGVIAFVLCMAVAESCNLLSLSDKTVIGLGVNIIVRRMVISVLSVLMAAVFTSIVGSVSFLGLVVPHMARLLVGSDHKKLIPYCSLLGALVFLAADTIGRSIAYPYEISAAVIMSIVGGPLLVILLKRNGAVYDK